MGSATYPLPGGLTKWDDDFHPVGLAAAAVLVTILSAASVFAFLFHRDNSLLLKAVPTRQLARASATTTRKTTRQPVSSDSVIISNSKVTVPYHAVARDHEELVALERDGRRNYTEFSIGKSTHFQPVGPVSMGVWRTDPRRKTCTLSVLADSVRQDISNVLVGESIWISARGHSVEFVVNRVDKDGISGYVSEPKTYTADLDKGSYLSSSLR
jgi:hypothetical protein